MKERNTLMIKHTVTFLPAHISDPLEDLEILPPPALMQDPVEWILRYRILNGRDQEKLLKATMKHLKFPKTTSLCLITDAMGMWDRRNNPVCRARRK